MQGLESARNASTESITRLSSITEQTSALLNERTKVGATHQGDKSATSLSFDHDVYGAEKAGSCSRADNACAWKPDANSHSQKTETWRAQRDAQRDKPVERPDGKYEVKPGDSMNDISRRYLKELGVTEPSNKDIAGMSKALADQNKDTYSILKCNPNLIQPGMKFEMPPADKLAELIPKNQQGTLGPSDDSGAWGTEFGPKTLKDGGGSGKAYGIFPAEQLPGIGNDKRGGIGTDVVPGGGMTLDLTPGITRSRRDSSGFGNAEIGPAVQGGSGERSVGGQGYDKIIGGGLKIFKDGSGDKGAGQVGECKRDDYPGGIVDTPLPYKFKIPQGITHDFGNGFITDDLVNRDLLSGRSQFMLLPYKYGEDTGIKMHIPSTPGDSKGTMQHADDKKDSSSFAKRFLENLALPQMYLI